MSLAREDEKAKNGRILAPDVLSDGNVAYHSGRRYDKYSHGHRGSGTRQVDANNEIPWFLGLVADFTGVSEMSATTTIRTEDVAVASRE
jgi:hypothetical protein